MEMREILHKITLELQECFEGLKEEQMQDLENRIRKAGKIYVAGAGRSLMMIRGLAMRLMHIGYQAYVVGETVTPAIEPGDLLIISSGSGSTETLVAIAGKCKRIGADLALITTMPDSPIGRLADCIVHVPASTTKSDDNTRSSFQPAANTFEQSVLLIGDTLIIHMTQEIPMEENNTVIMRKHANLE